MNSVVGEGIKYWESKRRRMKTWKQERFNFCENSVWMLTAEDAETVQLQQKAGKPKLKPIDSKIQPRAKCDNVLKLQKIKSLDKSSRSLDKS